MHRGSLARPMCVTWGAASLMRSVHSCGCFCRYFRESSSTCSARRSSSTTRHLAVMQTLVVEKTGAPPASVHGHTCPGPAPALQPSRCARSRAQVCPRPPRVPGGGPSPGQSPTCASAGPQTRPGPLPPSWVTCPRPARVSDSLYSRTGCTEPVKCALLLRKPTSHFLQLPCNECATTASVIVVCKLPECVQSKYRSMIPVHCY